MLSYLIRYMDRGAVQVVHYAAGSYQKALDEFLHDQPAAKPLSIFNIPSRGCTSLEQEIVAVTTYRVNA